MKASMRENWRWVAEFLSRPSGNGSVNFVIVRFRFVLYEGYKFYIFAPQISVLLFSHARVMGSHISHSSIGLEG